MSLADALIIRPVLRRLDGLTKAVNRVADLYEEKLAQENIFVRPPKADVSGDEPEALYVDEEMDAVRELAEAIKKGEKLS